MKDAFRVPLWASALGWAASIGFLLIYFYIVHACMRGLVPAFGFDVGATATAFFGTLVMSGFVIWLVSLAELPEMWFVHRRPRRLLSRGRCPNCAHQRPPEAEGRCPECGVAEEEIPPPYGYGWRAVQRFAVVLLIGIVGGVVAAEISISLDETRMVRQAERLGRTEWTFQRAWPATFARVDWTLDGGFVPRQFLQQHRHDRD